MWVINSDSNIFTLMLLKTVPRYHVMLSGLILSDSYYENICYVCLQFYFVHLAIGV